MKKWLKEIALFLSASACAGVLALFTVWMFLTHFPFEVFSKEPTYQKHVPHTIQTLTSSTLSEAEAKTDYGPGRTDFTKK